jgi:MFS family permease
LVAIFLVHFTGDFYQSFFPPLYPVLKAQFGLSLTQIGFLASVVTVAAFVAQPIAGMLADRYSPRRFMMAGLVLSTLFIPLMGVIPWFGMLVVVSGLGSLGSAIYHPTAAGMVPEFSGVRTGFAMSIFGLGGTIAHSIGPLAVTGFIVLLGIGTISEEMRRYFPKDRLAHFNNFFSSRVEESFYLDGLGVAPNYQRLGIGSRLIELTKKKTRQEGYNALSLIVFADNTEAIKLYERCGFQTVKPIELNPHERIPHQGGCLLMNCVLTADSA